MKKVIHLVDYSNQETQEMLGTLLALSMRGDPVGLALAMRRKSGEDDFLFTGVYRRPAEAVNAAIRMAHRLAMKQDGRL